MLNPYMVTQAVPKPDAHSSDTAWMAPVVHYCSTTQTLHIRRDTLTSQESTILGAVEETLHEICRALGMMWVDAFDIESAGDDRLSELVNGWKHQVKSLMLWLDWSIWIRCDPGCGPEVCSLVFNRVIILRP